MSIEGVNNFERKLESDYGAEDFLSKEPLTRRQFYSKMKFLLFADATIGGALVASQLTKKDLNDAIIKFEEVQKPKSNPEIKKTEVQSIEDEVVEEEIVEEPIEESVEQPENRKEIGREELFKLTLNLPYKEKVKPLVVENLNMPGEVSKFGVDLEEGKVLRTLRYQDITRAVEDRYNLPPNLLLSMILEESTGEDLLPNGRGDGGFGLCHMQGLVAKKELGLETFDGCDSMICDSKKGCKDSDGNFLNHAEQLKQFMIANKDDRKALVEADERLNILANIDAAARKVAAGIAGPKLKGSFSHLGHLRVGIARYSGTGNFEEYWKDVSEMMGKLEDSNYISEAVEIFNKQNPNLKANGKKVDYYGYLEEFRKEHINYGLEEYKKLQKYKPLNSEKVIASYKEFIK